MSDIAITPHGVPLDLAARLVRHVVGWAECQTGWGTEHQNAEMIVGVGGTDYHVSVDYGVERYNAVVMTAEEYGNRRRAHDGNNRVSPPWRKL